MTLGEKIKQLRENKGISQPQLAEKLGVSFKTISSWEINRTEPNVGMLIKLAEYFNTSIDEISGYNSQLLNTPTPLAAYNGTDPLKKEISNLLVDVLKKTDDITKLELLKSVISSFEN